MGTSNINNDKAIICVDGKFDAVNLLEYFDSIDLSEKRIVDIVKKQTLVDVYYPEIVDARPYIHVDSNGQSGFCSRFQEIIDNAYYKARRLFGAKQ